MTEPKSEPCSKNFISFHHRGPVCSLSLSCDGLRLASGSPHPGRDTSSEGEVRIWNLESGDCLTLPHGGERKKKD